MFNAPSTETQNVIIHDLIILNFRSLLTPKAIQHCGAYNSLIKLRQLFNYGIREANFLEDISNALVYLCKETKESNISLITSYLPLNGLGSDIMISAGVKLIWSFIPNDVDETLDWLPSILPTLKNLCQSNPTAASAVVSLVEATVAAAIKAGEIDQEIVKSIIESMKFTIPRTDPAMLTLLKEQLQVTRTQLELLLKSNFVVSSQTYE